VSCHMEQAQLEILEDYLAGALSRQETQELDAHLVGCAGCREALAMAREAGDLLKLAYQPAGPVNGAFWTRLGASLREERERRAGSDFWGAVEQLAWRLSFGAAALVVLLVGVVIGTQLPERASEPSGTVVEARDIFPEPVQASDGNEVLLELASGKGRMEGKR